MTMKKQNRYFADNIRDDYAAGQLDAQVCRQLVSATSCRRELL